MGHLGIKVIKLIWHKHLSVSEHVKVTEAADCETFFPLDLSDLKPLHPLNHHWFISADPTR